jgi:hypothetical protein
MNGDIVCVIGKNSRLYTFQIRNGKKKRVSNSFGTECSNVPKCVGLLCQNPKSVKIPCRKFDTVFNSHKSIHEYCQLIKNKPKGTYKRSEISERVKKANIELKKTSKSLKSKSKTTKVKFVQEKTPTKRKKN